MEKPLVKKKCLLEKIPGKGGWTYVRLPGIHESRRQAFGMVRVKGTIDEVAISDYNLMPMGNGMLMLPVNAGIRKKTGKQEGDFVMVILYPDHSPLHIPDELLCCLEDEPLALDFFNQLPDTEKRNYITWIFGAKRMETRAGRIAKSIAKMLRGKRRYDPEE